MSDQVVVEPINKIGGSNRKTREYREQGSKVVFQPTVASIVSISLFGLMFLLPFIFIAFMVFIDAIGYSFVGALVYLFLFFICFVIILWVYRRVSCPIYFDLQQGYFQGVNENRKKIKLTNIDRVHVVRKWIISGNTQYNSFELLLLLHDGAKVLVVDHSDGVSIKRDAACLADHLKVPCSSSIYK